MFTVVQTLSSSTTRRFKRPSLSACNAIRDTLMERTRKGNSWSGFLARLRADRANGISSGVVVRYVAWISPRSPEEYSLHRTQGREEKKPSHHNSGTLLTACASSGTLLYMNDAGHTYSSEICGRISALEADLLPVTSIPWRIYP